MLLRVTGDCLVKNWPGGPVHLREHMTLRVSEEMLKSNPLLRTLIQKGLLEAEPCVPFLKMWRFSDPDVFWETVLEGLT